MVAYMLPWADYVKNNNFKLFFFSKKIINSHDKIDYLFTYLHVICLETITILIKT